MKIKIFQLAFVLFIMFVLHDSAFAQPEFDDDVTDTPIDGGIVILTIASITYGVKKLFNKSKLES